ncbi:MAG: DNA helicase-2/ATP-dependent DNA helicase PcrA [Planctomycetota bacterium]
MTNISEILDGLNPEQRSAVEATEGSVLVLAGAGTGKTRVITVRIAHLLEKGVDPRNVLAMTFTNKAATEMRERVTKLVGKKKGKLLTVGTFHSFCVKSLREHAEMLGVPKKFAICDASDQMSALKGALRELRIAEATIQPRELSSIISLAKNRAQTPEDYLDAGGGDRDELIGRAWKRYDERLKRSAMLDFDDLLLYTLRLLRDFPTARAKFGQQYRYVLVDEYQDTNGVQFGILRQIAGEHKNICAVGDDDQSIYGWRGADIANILSFEKHYPGALVVRLETNYRSTNQILKAANRLIGNNTSRHEKSLRSALGDGPAIMAHRLRDEDGESEYVVKEIETLVAEAGANYSDFAILFRTATQPRAFETELRTRKIPYVLVGGMSFYDRKEVRDVLAYLKLMANKDDEVSLLRIINCPPRGVGKASIEKVIAFATSEGISVPAAFDRAEEIEGLPKLAENAVQALRANLKTLMEQSKELGVVDTIKRMLDIVGYKSEVERIYKDEKERNDRWASVGEVLNAAENHVNRRKLPSLRRFLEDLALSAGDQHTKEEPGKRNAVYLMTLHAAKGLEFPRVYLVGVEEGILPHRRSVEEDSIEEERRLGYVGVTRAKRYLTITMTAERAKYGTRVATHASRFFYEIKGEAPPVGWVATGTIEKAPPKANKKAKKKRKSRYAERA